MPTGAGPLWRPKPRAPWPRSKLWPGSPSPTTSVFVLATRCRRPSRRPGSVTGRSLDPSRCTRATRIESGPPRFQIEPRVTGMDPGKGLFGPIGVARLRKARDGQLADAGALDEVVPGRSEPLERPGLVSGPLGSRRLVRDVEHEARHTRLGPVDGPVVDIGTVRDHRSCRAGGFARLVVQIVVVVEAQRVSLDGDVGGQATRHHPRRAVCSRDVAQVDVGL